MAIDERYVDVSFGVSDSAFSSLSTEVEQQDTLQLAGVGTLGGVYSAVVSVACIFRGVLEVDGDAWECIALNTSGFFPSVYSGFAFNSFCEFEHNAYAADENGVYELVGNDDDGAEIIAGVMYHPTTLGNTLRKKFRKVFVDFTGTSAKLKAITDNGSREFVFKKNEAYITRDLRGRSWQFIIEGFDSFGYFEAFPIYLSR